MSIWLERLPKDDFDFFLHLVNALFWLERKVFSFVIHLELFQKQSLDYKDTLGYLTGPMLMRRRQKKHKIKFDNLQNYSKNQCPLFWLGRLQRDDSDFFLYTLKTLFSWLENETNSFRITTKLSPKHFSDKVYTFRYLRCLIWTRRS